MDQELTISKSLVGYFYNNLPAYKINNAQKCLEIIEQNYFVSDTKGNHKKNIFDELNSLPEGDKRKTIFYLVDHIIQNRTRNFDSQYSGEDSESEIQLSKITEDKLFLDLDLNIKEIKSKTKKYPEIEFLNHEILIKPETSHRFKNIPTIISLQKDVRFDLVEFLRPFLRNAKEITIVDPFLANKNAFSNLKNLFTLFIKNCNIKLNHYSEKDYLIYAGNNKDKKDKFIENYRNLNEEIESKKAMDFKIEIDEFTSRDHKERYILTEKFEIKIPGGLDCLDEYGFPSLKNEKERKKIEVNFL